MRPGPQRAGTIFRGMGGLESYVNGSIGESDARDVMRSIGLVTLGRETAHDVMSFAVAVRMFRPMDCGRCRFGVIFEPSIRALGPGASRKDCSVTSAANPFRN